MSDILRAALEYAEQGFSVIPLNGKKPATLPGGGEMHWKVYQSRRATRREIMSWAENGLLQNVGIVCGEISRLVVIDLDGLNAVQTFHARWSSVLPPTRVVKTGSGTGEHIYFRPNTMPRSKRAMNIPGGGNIEIRANGLYVVAPPSVHPDTALPYVANDTPIFKTPTLFFLEDWLDTFMRPVVVSRQSSPPNTSGKALRAMRWASAALSNEVRSVQTAPEGLRNNTLNRAAYSLGQIVADGLLVRSDVESSLLYAAMNAGLSERDSMRTIQSGLTAGMNNPRGKRNG
jgi:hypothetical protein